MKNVEKARNPQRVQDQLFPKGKPTPEELILTIREMILEKVAQKDKINENRKSAV